MTAANNVWVTLLGEILDYGTETRPRDKTTRELLVSTTRVPLINPVVTVARREMGYKFLAAEAAWVLSGDNRLSTLGPFSRQVRQFSDDRLTFRGAYGPKFIDQEPYVVACLNADPASRQAVITPWRERPGPSADVPCTVALQWLVRDDCLHVMVTMRSSDAWLGVPYDWHTFAMLTAHVLLSLRYVNPARWGSVALGDLYLTAASQHLYKLDWDAATAVMDDPAPKLDLVPLDLREFSHPDELTNHLWAVARGAYDSGGSSPYNWLMETY